MIHICVVYDQKVNVFQSNPYSMHNPNPIHNPYSINDPPYHNILVTPVCCDKEETRLCYLFVHVRRYHMHIHIYIERECNTFVNNTIYKYIQMHILS